MNQRWLGENLNCRPSLHKEGWLESGFLLRFKILSVALLIQSGFIPQCRILLVCVVIHSVVSDSLWPHGLYVAHQAPLCMGFSKQEYWSGLPFPSPGDLPDPGIELESLTLEANSLSLSHERSLVPSWALMKGGVMLIKMLRQQAKPEISNKPGLSQANQDLRFLQLLPNCKSNLQLFFPTKCLHMETCPYIISGLGKINPL